jgi:NTP pyrophosphatase (non-canonical NTP hydrolase)
MDNMTLEQEILFRQQCARIDDFSLDMKEKLRKNVHKLDWRECTFDYLVERLHDETRELLNELAEAKRRIGWTPHDLRVRIIEEAADVANFAMMIADIARHKH